MKKLAAFSSLIILGACSGGEALDAGTPRDGGETITRPPVRPDAGPIDPEIPVSTVTNVQPNTGPETGGTRVTIRGTSFLEPAQVFFGELEASSVVVLDEVSIAATTPPGAIGPVAVKVITDGGEGVLENAFIYHRELRLDRIDPARVPDEGGVKITLHGRGFDENTIVLMDRTPLRGLTVVDEERMEGWVPATEPGRPEIRVVNTAAAVRRSDLLYVYGTPDLTAVAPGYGPVGGRAAQEIAGEGFADADTVRFSAESGENLSVESNTRVTVDSPNLPEGRHDVTVANADTFGTLQGGFIAFDPSTPGVGVIGVTPPRASNAGGDVVAVVGYGFTPDTQIAIEGTRAQVTALSANAVSVVVPGGLPVGPVDILLITGGQTLNINDQLTLYEPVEVTAIDPATGPVTGGTPVTITGSGFTPNATVRIADVPLTDVVVVSDTEITGTTVAGAGGPQDVTVITDDTRGTLEDGFFFEEDFQIIAIEPREGSMAGNTYVTVIGRGFTDPVSVEFGEVEGLQPLLENGSVIGVRTQPAQPGPVDVEVTTGVQQELLPQAYTFYDPRLLTGGAWGGPIEGSVNVAVMDFNGNMLRGMVVQLGYDADTRYTAITDENGLATISSPEIRGAYTVTAGAPEVEYVTFMELNARNLTILATPHPQSMPPDAPVQPCPEPVAAPIVRGKIFRFKSALDEQTRPGWVPMARITYSQPNVFTPNPPEPPEQFAQVFREGQEYEIVVMRAGTVAVYAFFGDFNPETQQFIPTRMGIVRSVPVAPETVTEDVNISIDIELNQTVSVRLDNPPDQLPGPTINAVFPFLNLESDGVIAFPASQVFGDMPVTLTGMPALAESEFYYMGGSFSFNQQTGALTNPYSLTFLESGEAFEEGVDLGPFLQMPTNVSPKAGELLENGAISWDTGGIVPDITTIRVVDQKGVSGSCCMDLNRNGQCDAGEPIQGGGLPQQFNLWSIYGEGGLMSYVMPDMPFDLNGFYSPEVANGELPRQFGYLVQLAIAPRFNYSEFIYNNFSPFFWQSWVVYNSSIFVKEETD